MQQNDHTAMAFTGGRCNARGQHAPGHHPGEPQAGHPGAAAALQQRVEARDTAQQRGVSAWSTVLARAARTTRRGGRGQAWMWRLWRSERVTTRSHYAEAGPRPVFAACSPMSMRPGSGVWTLEGVVWHQSGAIEARKHGVEPVFTAVQPLQE